MTMNTAFAMSEMESNPRPNDDDPFVEMVAKSQVRLRTYICTLLRDRSATDDVLQDVNIALWKNRKTYDSNRDFNRWAAGVALIEVLRYRRKVATDKLLFDEALLNTLAADYIQQIEEADRREAALTECLKKLPAKDSWLLDAHYRSGVATARLPNNLVDH